MSHFHKVCHFIQSPGNRIETKNHLQRRLKVTIFFNLICIQKVNCWMPNEYGSKKNLGSAIKNRIKPHGSHCEYHIFNWMKWFWIAIFAITIPFFGKCKMLSERGETFKKEWKKNPLPTICYRALKQLQWLLLTHWNARLFRSIYFILFYYFNVTTQH